MARYHWYQSVTHTIPTTTEKVFEHASKNVDLQQCASLPGLADRAGKRYIADTTGKKSGGARVRGDVHPLSVDILHTDLREMYDDANWCR